MSDVLSPGISSELFSLAEILKRYSTCYWRFWEQDELAYATIYADFLATVAKSGTEEDLDNLMLTLVYGQRHPFTVRLLKRLRQIRSDEDN